MTNQITIEGRLASFEADGPLVAGNTYPVAVSYDSEWSGSAYLRVRFGSLYYDIPMTIADGASTADVQMPVGYPEVGLGVYSEALEICTNEARVRLLRSILEAGAEVVDFDGDLYDQWAGEVTALVTDDAFDAESTRPVQNAVLTAWKGQVEGGPMTIGGAKAFTSPVGVGTPTAPGHAVDMATLSGKLADGSVTKVGTSDVGTDAKPVKIVAGVPTAVGADLAADSAVVHKEGAETIPGAKTLTSNPKVLASTPGVSLQTDTQATDAGIRARLAVSDAYSGAGTALGEDSWGVNSGGYTLRRFTMRTPDRSASMSPELRVYSDHMIAWVTPYYPVDGGGNPQALTANALVASGNIAVDPRLMHTTGTETAAGNKTYTGQVKFESSPYVWGAESIGYFRKLTNYTHNARPESDRTFRVMEVNDASGNYLLRLNLTVTTDGHVKLRYEGQALKEDGTTQYRAGDVVDIAP